MLTRFPFYIFISRELTSIGVECIQPKAGSYIFLDFRVIAENLKKRGLKTSQQLCDALFDEAHVYVSYFGECLIKIIILLQAKYVKINGMFT